MLPHELDEMKISDDRLKDVPQCLSLFVAEKVTVADDGIVMEGSMRQKC